MRPFRRPPLALVPLLLAAAVIGTTLASPAAAQPTPVAELGEVGQGIEWTAHLQPTPLAAGESIVFVARGTVGARPDREIGRLLVVGTAEGIVAGADFRALGSAGLRIVLLDRGSPVVEVPLAADVDVIVPEDPIETAPAMVPPMPGGAAAEAVPAVVTMDLATFPVTVAGSVSVALWQRADVNSVSGEVLPAPGFELELGGLTDVSVGGETYRATAVRFLANSTFPPAGSPSAILERVDVFTSGPSLDDTIDRVVPGVLFSGLPVTPRSGTLGVDLDRVSNSIASIDLGAEEAAIVRAIVEEAAAVAVAWEAADLAAGAAGSSASLAAIARSFRSVEVRGVVSATRTAEGWDFSFAPPPGLAARAFVITVDGAPVAQVSVPLGAREALIGRSDQPPSGAVVAPTALAESAFYGFAWDVPVPIDIPGFGTFTGSELRVLLPFEVGTVAFAGIDAPGLPELTLTGLAAAEEDDGGLCIPTATTLCLTGDRFAVRAAWSDSSGGSGLGVPHPLTADSGAFWFFEPANLELVVKVLDACTVNDRFWVFAGGLTNVAVELTVTDTRTGAERVYTNPQGQAFQPITDTAAFATCAP